MIVVEENQTLSFSLQTQTLDLTHYQVSLPSMSSQGETKEEFERRMEEARSRREDERLRIEAQNVENETRRINMIASIIQFDLEVGRTTLTAFPNSDPTASQVFKKASLDKAFRLLGMTFDDIVEISSPHSNAPRTSIENDKSTGTVIQARTEEGRADFSAKESIKEDAQNFDGDTATDSVAAPNESNEHTSNSNATETNDYEENDPLADYRRMTPAVLISVLTQCLPPEATTSSCLATQMQATTRTNKRKKGFTGKLNVSSIVANNRSSASRSSSFDGYNGSTSGHHLRHL